MDLNDKRRALESLTAPDPIFMELPDVGYRLAPMVEIFDHGDLIGPRWMAPTI